MLMRVTANTLLFWLRPLVSSDEALYSMAGSLMSNLALIWSSVVLYRLGRLVLKDGQLAMRAALLYCFNPASIFFSVSMTEGLFAFLSFSGMLVLESAPVPSFRQRISASALFALATLTRSNGTLLGLHSLWAAHRAYVADASPRRMRRALMELAVVGGLHASALVSVLGFGWAHFCWNKDPRQPWCDWLVPSVCVFRFAPVAPTGGTLTRASGEDIPTYKSITGTWGRFAITRGRKPRTFFWRRLRSSWARAAWS